MDNIARLLVIISTLRDPEHGCAWDLKQTFASIAPHTIEEAYEVVDAIERGDLAGFMDELGDLLLQVVYYAQIAKERNMFDFDRIAKTIGDKLVRRHPHVFGDVKFADDQARARAYDAEKALERAAKQGTTVVGALHDVALNLPALTRARKLQKRAARVGFDWPDEAGVLAKIEEELAEVYQALIAQGGDEDQASLLPSLPKSPLRSRLSKQGVAQRFRDRSAATNADDRHSPVREEIGDLLFAVVNLARWRDVDPEGALRAANQKFERRFRAVEAKLAKQHRCPEDCTLEELDALWDEVKHEDLES